MSASGGTPRSSGSRGSSASRTRAGSASGSGGARLSRSGSTGQRLASAASSVLARVSRTRSAGVEELARAGQTRTQRGPHTVAVDEVLTDTQTLAGGLEIATSGKLSRRKDQILTMSANAKKYEIGSLTELAKREGLSDKTGKGPLYLEVTSFSQYQNELFRQKLLHAPSGKYYELALILPESIADDDKGAIVKALSMDNAPINATTGTMKVTIYTGASLKDEPGEDWSEPSDSSSDWNLFDDA